MKGAAALFVLLGLLLLAGAWREPANLGAKDWNWFLGQTEAEVTSLSRYDQFPYWSPWRRGGQVCFAQPESMFLSPVTPLALLVGTLLAHKLLLLPVYVLGALGLVALAGELGLAGRARLVPALVFFASSIYPLFVLAGLPNWLWALALLPWFLWAMRRARRDLRWLLLAGLLFAGLLHCGAIYWFTLFPVLFGLDALAQAVRARSVRPLLLLGAALLVGTALAAPRVLPLFEVYTEHPRQMPASGYYLPPELALSAWLSTDLPDMSTPNGCFVLNSESAVYWPFVGAYIGPLGALLAVLGALAGGRRAAGWVVAGAICFWAALGSGVHPSLWEALHALPGVASMHVPSRLLLLTSFCIALLAGFGWERLEAWLARLPALAAPAERAPRLRRPVALLLLGALVLPMLWVNAPLSAQAFTVPPTPHLVFAEEFRQRRLPQRPEQWLGEAYEAVRANAGNPHAATDIPTPKRVRTDVDPAYRGEVYLLSGAGSVHPTLTPNRIEVAVDAAQDDLLVVNQSWFPGWRAELVSAGAGPPLAMVEHEGLLAVRVPAGSYDLTLVFAPPGARRGFVIGALGVGLGLAWLVARRRAPPVEPRAPEWLALGGYGVLALMVAGGWSAPATGEAPVVTEEGPAWDAPERVFGGGAGSADAGDGGDARDDGGDARDDGGAASGPADLQPTLDGLPAGAVLSLPPGRYRGVRLTRGLTLAALPGAPGSEAGVEFEGPVQVSDVPAGERVALLALPEARLHLRAGLVAQGCAGEVLLQHVQLAALETGASLQVERCARVHLLGLDSGAVALRDSGAMLLRCEVRGGPGLPPLDAVASQVLLRDTRLEPVPAGAPAMRLRDAHLWESPDEEDAETGAAAPPVVQLVESRYGGGTLLLELSGPPGARGVVLISRASAMVPLAAVPPLLPQDVLVVADPREKTLLSVTLPETGRLTERMQLPVALRELGSVVFVQFVVESGAGLAVSAPDAALLELRGSLR